MLKESVHYGCAGIGVGPANLSLASLLHGHPELPSIFLDRREEFSWHDGQLLPDATLQVSMLKDLVSLADPTSEFSFLSYLHDQGKLYHFINAQFEAMPRHEFRNYLEWASRKNANVVFGEEVQSVTFDKSFVLQTSRRTITADNISVGIGRQPWVPPIASGQLGPTQFHVSSFNEYGSALAGQRVCVVGGGQSGAEAFLELISRPDEQRPRRVSWISRRNNFSPIDDSPFANEHFTPSYSDYFFSLEPRIRQHLNERHVLISDGISEATLRAIYQRIYVLTFIHGAVDQVALYPSCDVTAATPSVTGWSLSLASANHPGEVSQTEADVIIWATGYRGTELELLAPLAHRLERAGDEYRVGQDFTVQWDGPDDRNIFLLNAALQQRGLADKNLSLIAWRSQKILDRLLGRRSNEPKPSFVEWSAKPSSGSSAAVSP
jgi:lysine N6-hydroxylase